MLRAQEQRAVAELGRRARTLPLTELMQEARVRELGCDFAQGYLLSRPVPAAASLELVKTWRHPDI